MSLIALQTYDNNPIAIGKLVVIDADTSKPREYDSKTDSSADVIGVSYPKSSTTGRCAANLDGLIFSTNDYYEFDPDTLQYALDGNGELVPNSNFDPMLNPITATNYVIICICGMAPVLKGQQVPNSWKKVRENSSTNIYLLS